MFHRITLTLLAFAASFAFAAGVHAQQTPRFETIELAVEALAGAVTLPSGPDGALVMAPCGDCPLKSFRATRSTTYFVGEQQVTLGELAATVGARPEMPLTVSYSVKTGELTRVTADIATPRPTGGR